MATRMQQRRGTAAQWVSTNSGNGPILNAGEIGFETDTNKFKIGDGTNHWINLDYFIDANSTVNPSFGSSIVFEGATANAFETTVQVTDPTEDRTITLPNATGTVVLADGSGNVTVSGNLTVQGTTTTIDSSTIAVTNSFVFEGATANDYETTLTVAEPTADRTLTLPDSTGTLATQSYVDTAASNATFDASLAAGAGLDWNATTDQFDVDSSIATTSYVDTEISSHANDTTSIHGIADTSALATKTYADNSSSGAVSTHSSDTTDIHGIADTSLLSTKSYAETQVSTHNADTTSVHGIADTTVLVTTTDLSTAVSDHNLDTTNVHGIVDTSVLTTAGGTQTLTNKTLTSPKINEDVALTVTSTSLNYVSGVTSAIQTQLDNKQAVVANVSDTEIGYLDGVTSAIQTQLNNKQPIVANVSDVEIGYLDGVTSSIQTQLNNKQAVVADVSDTEIGYLNGVTSAIQTQIDAKASSTDLSSHATDTTSIHGISDTAQLAYLNAANQTFTGNMEVDGNVVVDGNFTVNGTNFSASATSITIEDNIVQLAHQNAANTVDLGLVVAYNDGAAKHSGLVRDVSEDEWKLFKGVTTEPTTTVNFGQGSLDNLELNNLVAAGVVFTDGTQTKEGVASRTPIIQKTASYTLSALTERDSLIEVSSSSGVTVSIPTDATLNYPIGTSIDILQTSTGQVTIAAVTPGTTTVNATPGLKLRTQWSSATLFKRAANTWVVYGDLMA